MEVQLEREVNRLTKFTTLECIHTRKQSKTILLAPMHLKATSACHQLTTLHLDGISQRHSQRQSMQSNKKQKNCCCNWQSGDALSPPLLSRYRKTETDFIPPEKKVCSKIRRKTKKSSSWRNGKSAVSTTQQKGGKRKVLEAGEGLQKWRE